MEKYDEFALTMARQVILDFFEGDEGSASAFHAVAEHMMGLEEGLLIRKNCEIIGVAKPGEYFRFYIIKEDESFWIKYKHQREKIRFTGDSFDPLFEMNVACQAYFDQNRTALISKQKVKTEKSASMKQERSIKETVGGTADEPMEALMESAMRIELRKQRKQERKHSNKEIKQLWSSIREKADRARRIEQKPLNQALFDGFWQDMQRLLDSCVRTVLDERRAEIVLNRIVYQTDMTLRDFAEVLSVSREMIRQLQMRGWRQVSKGIYNGAGKEYVPFRERLFELLNGLPDEMLWNVIACAYSVNEEIALWLERIMTNQFSKKLSTEQMRKMKLEGRSRTFLVESKVRQYQLMQDAATYYHERLRHDPNAAEAISVIHSWGLYGQTVVKFGLGYGGREQGDFLQYMTVEKGYSEEELLLCGLLYEDMDGNYCEILRDSITIPTYDREGRVVCIDHYLLHAQIFAVMQEPLLCDRSTALYSMLPMTESKKKSLVLVGTYTDYYALYTGGITNAAAFFKRPMKLEEAFEGIEPQRIIAVLPSEKGHYFLKAYCEKRAIPLLLMIPPSGQTVLSYIFEHREKIVRTIEFYEK